jgi:hypothetical protein
VAEILRDVRKDVAEFLDSKTAENPIVLEADTSNSGVAGQLIDIADRLCCTADKLAALACIDFKTPLSAAAADGVAAQLLGFAEDIRCEHDELYVYRRQEVGV